MPKREAYEAFNPHKIPKYRKSYNFKANDPNKDRKSYLDKLLCYIKMNNVILPATKKSKFDAYSDELFDKLANGELFGPAVIQFHYLDDRLV